MSSVEYINKTGKEVITRAADTDKAAHLETDLASLNGRWSHVSMVINERLGKLEQAIARMKQYMVNYFNMNQSNITVNVFVRIRFPTLIYT